MQFVFSLSCERIVSITIDTETPYKSPIHIRAVKLQKLFIFTTGLLVTKQPDKNIYRLTRSTDFVLKTPYRLVLMPLMKLSGFG